MISLSMEDGYANVAGDDLIRVRIETRRPTI